MSRGPPYRFRDIEPPRSRRYKALARDISISRGELSSRAFPFYRNVAGHFQLYQARSLPLPALPLVAIPCEFSVALFARHKYVSHRRRPAVARPARLEALAWASAHDST